MRASHEIGALVVPRVEPNVDYSVEAHIAAVDVRLQVTLHGDLGWLTTGSQTILLIQFRLNNNV